MNLLSTFKAKLATALLALALCATDAAAMEHKDPAASNPSSAASSSSSSAITTLGETKAIAPLTGSRGKKLKKLLYDELDPMPPELIAIIVEYENYELQGRCVKILNGHIAGINCVIQLTNGRYKDYIASASCDSTIMVWDPKTGECIRTLNFHTDSIDFLLQLPDSRLASGSADGTIFIEIWDLPADEKVACLQTLTGHTDWVNCLIQLSNGYLASCSDDNTIKIWNPKTGECVKTFTDQTYRVQCLIQLADSRLASGSNDHNIKIWDLNADEKVACVKTLNGHTGCVFCLIQLADSRLASGSADGTMHH
jgi:WD40 repeat protein